MANCKPFLLLQRQIIDSTIWHQPLGVRVLWVTILVIASEPGRKGVIDMPLKSIAARANMTESETAEAIKILCSPDPQSRTPDKEGRRLELLEKHRDWGWRVVNWEKHEAERKASFNAERQNRYRLRNQGNAIVTPRNKTLSREGEGEGEGYDKNKNPNTPAKPAGTPVFSENGKLNAGKVWIDANKFMGRTVTVNGKASGIFKRLNSIPGITDKDLEAWMLAFLNDNDTFVEQSGCSLAVFETRIDKYRNPPKTFEERMAIAKARGESQ